jgi:spore coat protein U-like protein
MNNLVKTSVLLLGMLASVSVCVAGTVTTTFNVTATIATACQLETTTIAPLAFGTIIGTAESKSTTSLSVACSNALTYHIALNEGSHASSAGDTNTRRLTDGAVPTPHYLSYDLYRDSDYSTHWGKLSSDYFTDTGNGSYKTITVYGKTSIVTPPVNTGSYSDTITATITW